MTDVQRILIGLSEKLCDHHINDEACTALSKALDGVPPEHHMSALVSMLEVDEPDFQDMDDNLVIKSYTAPNISVGDEVQFNGSYGIKRGVVLAVNGKQIIVVFDSGVATNYSASLFTRTGRNFPAIPAILDELKNG